MNKFFLSICMALCAYAHTYAQSYSSQTLFPGVTGQALLDSVYVKYKTYFTYAYNVARDTMYVKVYKDDVQDSIECFYTGMKKSLPDFLNGEPARTVLWEQGAANGINAEHAYPQSKGAVGLAQSDMHILFPARASANSGRSNLPYGEIADNQVTTWYKGVSETSSMPAASERHLYSKLRTNTSFEPRDVVKGNMARSIFYFYSMYKAEADAYDPNFFERQRETLCRWHMEDPVDSLEWHRTWIIAGHQQNKPNPYILDCSLAKRTFCNTVITDACTALSVDQTFHETVETVKFFPNPVQYEASIYMNLVKAGDIRISILDVLGREIQVINDSYVTEGEQVFQWYPADNLANGMYFYRIILNDQQQISRPINLLR